MAYAIRPFQSDDAGALAELTLAAIRKVGSRSYSASQVDAWAARHPGPERLLNRVSNGALIIVAVSPEGSPVAYALLELTSDHEGHLDMLYCHPDHTRQGLADRLLYSSEKQARELGVTRSFTEASELARPAFERSGYTVLHRRDFEIEGVPIHNHAMEKHLD